MTKPVARKQLNIYVNKQLQKLENKQINKQQFRLYKIQKYKQNNTVRGQNKNILNQQFSFTQICLHLNKRSNLTKNTIYYSHLQIM